MFRICKNLDFNDAVKLLTIHIHIRSKIIGNIELSSGIIKWLKIVANKWSNTVELCNCRSATVMMGAILVEGATVEIGATLVEGVTLEIGEWCKSRRRNSVDWHNTSGRCKTGEW